MTGTFAVLAANPNLSHAEALQKSMLAMIDNAQRPDWADPRHWAPFVVVGSQRSRRIDLRCAPCHSKGLKGAFSQSKKHFSW